VNHTDQIWTNLMRSFRQEFEEKQCKECEGRGWRDIGVGGASFKVRCDCNNGMVTREVE
jgi:hypothetical protein